MWCWERLLRVPWTARRSNQSILKEINPEYSLEGLMLKLKLQYFGHLMWRTDSLEKTLMLGKIEGRRRRGIQRIRWLYVITDSMDMSLSWWWTGKPGVLKSMESQSWTRLSDWTELNRKFGEKACWKKKVSKKYLVTTKGSNHSPLRNAVMAFPWNGSNKNDSRQLEEVIIFHPTWNTAPDPRDDDVPVGCTAAMVQTQSQSRGNVTGCSGSTGNPMSSSRSKWRTVAMSSISCLLRSWGRPLIITTNFCYLILGTKLLFFFFNVFFTHT